MDRLAQLSTFFLVAITVGLILREWTDWATWIVVLVTAAVALLVGYLTNNWWANWTVKNHWKIYKDE